jgi:hypothetical protein
MSFVDKVGALRRLIGIDLSLELQPAIAAMNAAMGIIGEGALPAQVDALVDVTGMQVTAAPPAATPATGLAANTAPAAAVGGKKRKAVATTPTLSNKKQRSLFAVLPHAVKTSISKEELRKQRELATTGVAYTPRYSDVQNFESERGDSSASPPVKVYHCTRCTRTFAAPAALALHEKWGHESSTEPRALTMPSRPPPPRVAMLLVVATGGSISIGFTIAGRPMDEVRVEATVAAERAVAEAAARHAETQRRSRLREAEAEGDRGEHRHGSGKRHQYSAKEQVEMVDICNRIYDEGLITNKGSAWKDKARNPKYYGVAFTNVVKWRKPEEHRRLLKAAARAHAGSLLRIDQKSRKQGKYASMEKELFGVFKARRARSRKASARWLTHTARHLLRQSNAEAAAGFKGGKSWRRRFRNRWGLSIRKKTNGKNTTWEETKPVLQRYFRALRRRVTLSENEMAAYEAEGSSSGPAAAHCLPC